MESQVNLQRNIFFYLEDSMVMYGIHYSDTWEKLIDTVHKVNNKTTWNEKLLVGMLNYWYQWYLTKTGIQLYAINSHLHITTMREKYNRIYEQFIRKLQMYVQCILSKGYLPITILHPTKLLETLEEAKRPFKFLTKAMIWL